MPGAKVLIGKLRQKCRAQSEQILAWKKAYNIQRQQHYHFEKSKNDQLNSLTSQLLLLESRLRRKQKHIASILGQRDLTMIRQQKLIDALSSRLVDHGLDTVDPAGSGHYTDFDSLNDSDSAVVLEDIDSDCNSSIIGHRRRTSCGSSGIDVTIVRSISDAIETKYTVGNARRSNCFLRRPDILETVYSVEEDPEPDANEKRDKFKNRSEKIASDCSDDSALDKENNSSSGNYHDGRSASKLLEKNDVQLPLSDKLNGGRGGYGEGPPPVVIVGKQTTQVTNYNRVMSNHRSVTKPKDVKYKRINKAKSKSLEELRGRLRHWVEKGNNNNINNNIEMMEAQKQAQSFA